MAYNFGANYADEIAAVSTLPEYQTAQIRIEDPSLVSSSYDVETGQWTTVGDPVVYEGQARIIGVRWGVTSEGESQANRSTISSIRVQIPQHGTGRVKRGCKVFVMSAPNTVLTSYAFTVTSDMQGASAAARTFECALDMDVQLPPSNVVAPVTVQYGDSTVTFSRSGSVVKVVVDAVPPFPPAEPFPVGFEPAAELMSLLIDAGLRFNATDDEWSLDAVTSPPFDPTPVFYLAGV